MYTLVYDLVYDVVTLVYVLCTVYTLVYVLVHNVHSGVWFSAPLHLAHPSLGVSHPLERAALSLTLCSQKSSGLGLLIILPPVIYESRWLFLNSRGPSGPQLLASCL